MDRLVNRSVAAMLKDQVISEEQKAVMIYGLDLLYSSIISLLSFVVLGFVLKRLVPTLVLLLFFIPLQSFLCINPDDEMELVENSMKVAEGLSGGKIIGLIKFVRSSICTGYLLPSRIEIKLFKIVSYVALPLISTR